MLNIPRECQVHIHSFILSRENIKHGTFTLWSCGGAGQKGRKLSILPHGLVKGPFPNEKYSKIIENSQNFNFYPLILIPNLCNLECKI